MCDTSEVCRGSAHYFLSCLENKMSNRNGMVVVKEIYKFENGQLQCFVALTTPFLQTFYIVVAYNQGWRAPAIALQYARH